MLQLFKQFNRMVDNDRYVWLCNCINDNMPYIKDQLIDRKEDILSQNICKSVPEFTFQLHGHASRLGGHFVFWLDTYYRDIHMAHYSFYVDIAFDKKVNNDWAIDNAKVQNFKKGDVDIFHQVPVDILNRIIKEQRKIYDDNYKDTKYFKTPQEIKWENEEKIINRK